MAPQRFSSVHQKTRPAARVPFRDDTTLVALRYEETVQAEPPIPIIPIPPRNPARQNRPRSALGATSPIIIARPPIPPQEQHPALRARPCRPIAEEWKRDSGLAATASTVTIRADGDDDDTRRKREEAEEDSGPLSPLSVTSTSRLSFSQANAPSGYQSRASLETSMKDLAPRIPIFEVRSEPSSPIGNAIAAITAVAAATAIDTTARPIASEEPRSAPSSPTLAREASRRLAKAFSLRYSASRRQKKKEEEEAAAVAAKSGDLKSPKSAKPKMFGANSGSRDSESTSAPASAPTPPDGDANFTPISTTIPTESLIEDDFLTSLTFSKRGSLMFGGKRAFALAPPPLPSSSSSPLDASSPSNANANADEQQAASQEVQGEGHEGGGDGVRDSIATTTSAITPTMSTTTTIAEKQPSQAPAPLPSVRVLSLDVERESQKVRSLYESGEDAFNWEDGGPRSSLDGRLAPTVEVPSEEAEAAVPYPSSDDHRLAAVPASSRTPRSASSLSLRRDSALRREHELAGGIEDWENVDGADVDRYGFITIRRPQTSATTPDASPSRGPSPRRRHLLARRPGSSAYASSSLTPERAPSRKVSARSLNTQASELSTTSRLSARASVRAATNLLPHNRDRRWMDEAGDMLTLAPGLADITEDADAVRISEALKKKEWERSEKWRKMAKVVRRGRDGEGMDFEFDVKNPKLIERTWKGIPDRWRAAAWFSFLATSAKRGGSSAGKETQEHIVAEFHRLQNTSSSDDVQIDLDVPRTINRHIMFRKRYRGGQRLLFRVLHALSLYFPDIGYVQGMASLAATLLCYYDEERCFVMLVRMWRLRGLARLYQPGFPGLMAALKDFEDNWLAGKEVARKLSELNIDPMAYGTRWYLTLFSLSVPFPAQLRVWDVFMLLGDAPPPPSTPLLSSPSTPAQSVAGSATDAAAPAEDTTPPAGIDILHATSAALIDGLREVLLDSDFENAMKALTSWVPIKDEELLMKVTRAEWKHHQGKKKG